MATKSKKRGLFGYDGVEHMLLTVTGLAFLAIGGFILVFVVALFAATGWAGILWVVGGLVALLACWSIGWLFNQWKEFL